jgi:hypothetical protein
MGSQGDAAALQMLLIAALLFNMLSHSMQWHLSLHSLGHSLFSYLTPPCYSILAILALSAAVLLSVAKLPAALSWGEQ